MQVLSPDNDPQPQHPSCVNTCRLMDREGKIRLKMETSHAVFFVPKMFREAECWASSSRKCAVV